MSDPKKAVSNEEVHGYDALDGLESESFDRAPATQQPHADSAYDQLWLGEDPFTPVQ
jgi:hypothetical protein